LHDLDGRVERERERASGCRRRRSREKETERHQWEATSEAHSRPPGAGRCDEGLGMASGAQGYVAAAVRSIYSRATPRPRRPRSQEPAMKHFGSEALAFFRGLSRHNAKPWFESHRGDYEQYVKQPLADLVHEMDHRFASF